MTEDKSQGSEKILASIRERHGIIGDILAMMSTIDFHLTFVLTKQICKEDKEMVKLVMPLLDNIKSFHVKLEAFEYLSFLYKDFFENHPTLISDIRKMQELRNKLAHRMIKDEGNILVFIRAGDYGSSELSTYVYPKENHIDNISTIDKSIEALQEFSTLIKSIK